MIVYAPYFRLWHASDLRDYICTIDWNAKYISRTQKQCDEHIDDARKMGTRLRTNGPIMASENPYYGEMCNTSAKAQPFILERAP